MLWDRCGSGGSTRKALGLRWPISYYTSPPKFPKVRHLAALASDPVRLDWHTKQIQGLFFGLEAENDGDDESTPGLIDESQYYPVFATASFPKLRVLDIEIPKHDQNHYSSSSFLQYLQPRLEYFRITGGALSDQLLYTLSVRNHFVEVCACYTRMTLILCLGAVQISNWAYIRKTP